MIPLIPPNSCGVPDLLAYLDPGTGALILQALVGGALAVGLFAKSILRKIRGIFGKPSAKPGESGSGEPPETGA